MTKTITFSRIAYRPVTARDPKDENNFITVGIAGEGLKELSGSELLELYNLVSSNLGRGRVKRFADTKSAVRRTWAILEEYAQQVEDEAAIREDRDSFEGEPVVLKQTRTADGASVLSAADQAQIKDEAKARKAAPTSTVERWRTPKRREPSKRCYMPRPGSKQDTAYQLLTQEGGIRVEDLCAAMSKLDTSGKNSTEWKEPGTIWGSLNYLFVTQKGYGLAFDGERIQLLKGKEEVPFNNSAKKG